MNRENQILEILIDDIIPNRFQPRLTFDEKALNELAQSIKEHGIIQPLILRKIGDKYEIIAGERRYKASQIAGLTKVPAIVMNLDDNESAEVAVIENLQRKDLTPIEEAKSYKKLLDKGYLTQEQLAKRMGISQPSIANKLRLLNLCEPVQEALLENKISERHARSLLALNDPELQVQILNKILSNRLTVKQTDNEINKLLGKNTSDSSESTSSENASPVSNSLKPTNTNNSTNIFDLNVEEIKSNSSDIIKQEEPRDFSELLRKEEPKPIEENISSAPVSLEDSVTNFDMGDIISPTNINPFQETEILDENFQTNNIEPTPINLENNNYNQNINNFGTSSNIFNSQPMQETPSNSIMDEFRQQKSMQNPYAYVEPISSNVTGGLSSAITATRDCIEKLKTQGNNVETEEFDFEDMYQIIIKIKK